MKRALYLAALLAATSVPTFAAEVTYDIGGTITNGVLLALNGGGPSTLFNIDPNSPLTENGVQFINGDPLVVGTLSFDPDYQRSSHLPVPVTFSFSFEGMTISRDISHAIGIDSFTTTPTGFTTHVESRFSTTGALVPDRADITMNFAPDGTFTGGSFNFADLSGGGGPGGTGLPISGGAFTGTITSATPVGVPEPGEFALLLTGFAAAIGLSMRRKGPALARG